MSQAVPRVMRVIGAYVTMGENWRRASLNVKASALLGESWVGW